MICYIGGASHSVIFIIEGGELHMLHSMSIFSLDDASFPAVINYRNDKVVHKVIPGLYWGQNCNQNQAIFINFAFGTLPVLPAES